MYVKARGEDYFYPSGKHEIQWVCNCDCNPSIDVLVKASNLNCKNPILSCGCKLHDKKGNRYDLSGEYGIGWTTNTNKEFYFDLEDYEKIKDYTWFENDNGYIVSDSVNRQRIRLHRFVLNLGLVDFKENLVDHINHNIKDNRKCNLRQCSSSQNNMNKKPIHEYAGIRWREEKHRWEARICKEKDITILGLFKTKEEAIEARIKAEQSLFKEFSYAKSVRLSNEL